MSIASFNTDVNIITGLSNKPVETQGLTAAQLKAKFDAAAVAIKAYINATLVAAINALQSDTHTHSNKAVLDTYAQTESNLSDAVSKKHSHTNKSTLDTYTQTESNLSDAVSKKHSHTNKSTLDTYTQTESNLADAVSKKHSHTNSTVLSGIASDNLLFSSSTQTIAGDKIFSGQHKLTSRFVIDTSVANLYGTSEPSSPVTGQVFFKVVS